MYQLPVAERSKIWDILPEKRSLQSPMESDDMNSVERAEFARLKKPYEEYNTLAPLRYTHIVTPVAKKVSAKC